MPILVDHGLGCLGKFQIISGKVRELISILALSGIFSAIKKLALN